MSDFLKGKDYNEYFEKLNNRLNSTESLGRQPVKKPPEPKRGIYKTIKIKKSFYIAALAVILSLILLIAFTSKGCSDTKANAEKPNYVGSVNPEKEEKEIKIAYTEDFVVEDIPETNDADSVIVIRKSDNKIIAQRNPHKVIHPASTLKIMTLLTAVDYITDYNDTFTMSLKITDPLFIEKASMAGFLRDESITMTDLIYGMILPSGAEAAMGLAVKIAGSEEAFVELMNQKAKRMGLENSHFANVTGLHHEENYSTAYDMAVIIDHAYQNEFCRKVLSTFKYTTSETEQNPKGIELKSTLFSHMYGTEPETATILGGKTGFVNEAGYCIASFGQNLDKTEDYIVVTMGNSSIWPAIRGQIELYKQFAK